MREQSPRLILEDSPAAQRRERQQQQRSTCCCCLLVVISIIIVIIAFRHVPAQWLSRGEEQDEPKPKALFPLSMESNAESYYRYGLIHLTARLVDPQGQPVVAEENPRVTVFFEGQAVTTIGNTDELRLKYDRDKERYGTWWPVPWNPQPGTYVAEARVEISDPGAWTWYTPDAEIDEEERNPDIEGTSWCIARVQFEIKARQKPDFPPGTCIATWEPDFRAGSIPGPHGEPGDWRKMYDWAEYIGADTFWFRGAVTEAYTGKLTMENPFNTKNLEAIPKLAAEAHRRGMKFGAWASGYATYPARSNENKPAYEFATDISRSTGKISEKDFVSLLDSRRIDHLAEFFRRLEKEPNVDHIGLDYWRSDRGGYEMVDRFSREMPARLPDNWANMSEKQRMLYVAKKVEGQWQEYPYFYECWNWWRARIGSLNLRRLIEESGVTKPVWIFVLSWEHGVQHGQDPLMFTDAGATLLAPMLYQVEDRGHYNRVKKAWAEYLRTGQVNLAVGDQVDDYWHQKTRKPAAPEELYRRITEANAELEPGDGYTTGAFWHDISRASLGGRRGPYPGSEWGLAGGAAFTVLRNRWKVYPLTAEMAELDKTGGARFTARVSIKNIAETNISNIRLRVLDTEKVDPTGDSQRTVAGLGPGEVITVPFPGRVTGPAPDRANRYMVAIEVTWPAGDYGEQFRSDLPRKQIVMEYLQR